MFIEIVLMYATTNKYIQPQPPATKDEIIKAETSLAVTFPMDLCSLLSEMNGDHFLCLSTEEIVSTNKSCREDFSEYVDLSNLLFFAGNGCGDYYAFSVENGVALPSPVFIWEHESFTMHEVANNLVETINRYYQGQI